MSRPYRGESAEEWLRITCPDDLRHPYPTDYEPEYEPEEYLPYCLVCERFPVMRIGDKCPKCAAVPTEIELRTLAVLSDAMSAIEAQIERLM